METINILMSEGALSHLHCLHAHCLLYRIPICPIENSVMTLLCSEYKTVYYCIFLVRRVQKPLRFGRLSTVGCLFLMVVVYYPMLQNSQAEFRPNDHRENVPHLLNFVLYVTYSMLQTVCTSELAGGQ